jgi:hypothetical protein
VKIPHKISCFTLLCQQIHSIEQQESLSKQAAIMTLPSKWKQACATHKSYGEIVRHSTPIGKYRTEHIPPWNPKDELWGALVRAKWLVGPLWLIYKKRY